MTSVLFPRRRRWLARVSVSWSPYQYHLLPVLVAHAHARFADARCTAPSDVPITCSVRVPDARRCRQLLPNNTKPGLKSTSGVRWVCRAVGLADLKASCVTLRLLQLSARESPVVCRRRAGGPLVSPEALRRNVPRPRPARRDGERQNNLSYLYSRSRQPTTRRLRPASLASLKPFVRLQSSLLILPSHR